MAEEITDEELDRYLTLQPDLLSAPCICGNPPRRPIQELAEEYDFTYEEAFEYVIIVGLAYARRPPLTAPEPGA